MQPSKAVLEILATLPHVKKAWIKGDQYHLTAPTEKGWIETEVNGESNNAPSIYEGKSLKELREICKSREIDFENSAKIPDLVEQLTAWDADPNNALD